MTSTLAVPILESSHVQNNGDEGFHLAYSYILPVLKARSWCQGCEGVAKMGSIDVGLLD